MSSVALARDLEFGPEQAGRHSGETSCIGVDINGDDPVGIDGVINPACNHPMISLVEPTFVNRCRPDFALIHHLRNRRRARFLTYRRAARFRGTHGEHPNLSPLPPGAAFLKVIPRWLIRPPRGLSVIWKRTSEPFGKPLRFTSRFDSQIESCPQSFSQSQSRIIHPPVTEAQAATGPLKAFFKCGKTPPHTVFNP